MMEEEFDDGSLGRGANEMGLGRVREGKVKILDKRAEFQGAMAGKGSGGAEKKKINDGGVEGVGEVTGRGFGLGCVNGSIEKEVGGPFQRGLEFGLVVRGPVQGKGEELIVLGEGGLAARGPVRGKGEGVGFSAYDGLSEVGLGADCDFSSGCLGGRGALGNESGVNVVREKGSIGLGGGGILREKENRVLEENMDFGQGMESEEDRILSALVRQRVKKNKKKKKRRRKLKLLETMKSVSEIEGSQKGVSGDSNYFVDCRRKRVAENDFGRNEAEELWNVGKALGGTARSGEEEIFQRLMAMEKRDREARVERGNNHGVVEKEGSDINQIHEDPKL